MGGVPKVFESLNFKEFAILLSGERAWLVRALGFKPKERLGVLSVAKFDSLALLPLVKG